MPTYNYNGTLCETLLCVGPYNGTLREISCEILYNLLPVNQYPTHSFFKTIIEKNYRGKGDEVFVIYYYKLP